MRAFWLMSCAVALAAFSACGKEREARFSATCAPDEAFEHINCTIENHGTKAGRACVTARVQPEQGSPILAQRTCTGAIEPGHKVGVTPQFPHLGRGRHKELLAGRCAKAGTWQCKVEIVETPAMLGENLPAIR